MKIHTGLRGKNMYTVPKNSSSEVILRVVVTRRLQQKERERNVDKDFSFNRPTTVHKFK